MSRDDEPSNIAIENTVSPVNQQRVNNFMGGQSEMTS